MTTIAHTEMLYAEHAAHREDRLRGLTDDELSLALDRTRGDDAGLYLTEIARRRGTDPPRLALL